MPLFSRKNDNELTDSEKEVENPSFHGMELGHEETKHFSAFSFLLSDAQFHSEDTLFIYSHFKKVIAL